MRNHLFHDPELEEMARVAADLGATMMPFTTLTEKALLGLELGDTAPSIPGTHYVGLLVAGSWAATTAYSSGQYVIGSAFASTNRHIYKCTTGGTSGGSEPTWNQTIGGTTTDGSVTWTEVSALFAAGTTTGAEPYRCLCPGLGDQQHHQLAHPDRRRSGHRLQRGRHHLPDHHRVVGPARRLRPLGRLHRRQSPDLGNPDRRVAGGHQRRRHAVILGNEPLRHPALTWR